MSMDASKSKNISGNFSDSGARLQILINIM